MAPFRSLVVLAPVGCFPSTALAQRPPDSTLTVEVGKPLFVTMKNGDRIEGLAGKVAVDGITIATPTGIRTGTFTDIDRVEKRDPGLERRPDRRCARRRPRSRRSPG